MRDDAVRHAMLIIAAITPPLGVIAWWIGRKLARDSAEAGEPNPVRRLGLKCVVLGLAGPINLGLWYVFNGWLDQVGYRSVLGYGLAALVFLGGGWLTGWFSRRRSGS